MPSIKFNQFTREIEMNGSESFIESNFNKIQHQLVESFGVKKVIASKKAKKHEQPISNVRTKEFQAGAERKRHEQSETSPTLQATGSFMTEFSHELKAKRPPLRKYIRKEGIPGHQRTVIEVNKQKPNEISIASLREKFGLSESTIGGIIRDAEKLGKVRRVTNGSFAWT
jgi:hypothetical protein